MRFSNHHFHRMEKEIFKKRIGSFYRPFLELFTEADLYRPEGEDVVYQMTGLQCIATGVFVAVWLAGILLLSSVMDSFGFFGSYITLLIVIFTFPYVVEGPRFLFPWRCVQKQLYNVRWKSKWGFALALFWGVNSGWVVAVLLSYYL